MICPVETLLEKSEEACEVWVEGLSAEQRNELFDEIWGRIRGSRLYGGQPRNEESTSSVTMAQLALSLGKHTADERLMVEAWCMMAYTLNANEQWNDCLEYYRLAINGLEKLQEHQRAARNRLGFLVALSMVGRYEEAIAVGLEAEDSFRLTGDEEGHARLCVNLGTVYQRLDQHSLSLEYHVKAIEYFTRAGNEQALAQVYLNAGNALGCLARFDEADGSYAASVGISSRLGLAELAAQARYNRAYLYFLRGRNMQAVEHYEELRILFNENGSHRHAALCDLDETEIYLQLNLPKEAARLARSAIQAFDRLVMRYEQAKATVYLAIALTQNRQFGDALQLFQSAQVMFEKESNRYWIALSMLYRAEVLYAIGRLWEARSIASSAYETFTAIGVNSKRIVSMMLLGRIALDLNQHTEARTYAQVVLDWTTDDANPLLLFPCYSFCAYVVERSGNPQDARRFYEYAAREIESRQTHLHYDELRIPFFPDKQAVYEALARLNMDLRSDPVNLSDAYEWCERAKSSGMVDLVAHHLPSIRNHSGEALLSRISRIRDELNNSYLRLRSEKADMPSVSHPSSIHLQEGELLRTLRELSEVDPEYAALQQASVAPLQELQPVLPEDTTLIEYFIVGGEVVAFVISRNNTKVFRHISPVARIRFLVDQLHNHFSKLALTCERGRGESEVSPAFAHSRLAELYSTLIAPLRDELKTPGLILMPHGIMHYIPFAALFNGQKYLLDEFHLSYAPNGSVLRSAMKRKGIDDGQPLVLGRPGMSGDPEFESLRRLLPQAQWYTGSQFTRERLLNGANRSDFMHISTDVEFRQDNPLFSSIRCADSWLTAIDVYSMSCETNLVTLNANVAGPNAVAGSESLLAITEALFYAGARSVLTNLWKVDKKTAAEFFAAFYAEWRQGATKAQAMQRAAIAVRRMHEHPFFWAPYILSGQP